MRETSNLSEKRNLISPENIQNLRDVLNICKEHPEISSILLLRDNERGKKDSIEAKLIKLGNYYYQLFNSYEKRKVGSEKDFYDMEAGLKGFLLELVKIFDVKVNAGEKGGNAMIDKFVKEIFGLNDAFYGLNEDLNIQKKALSGGSGGLGLGINPSVIGTTKIRNDLDFMKEDNKRLGIIVYQYLLRLMDEELNLLLGSLDDNKILTKKEFEKMFKKLYIADSLNIGTYEEFCDKYDILKNKQRGVSEMMQIIDGYFDEEGNLMENVEFKKLHMKKTTDLLKINILDLLGQQYSRTKQKVAKVLRRKNK